MASSFFDLIMQVLSGFNFNGILLYCENCVLLPKCYEFPFKLPSKKYMLSFISSNLYYIQVNLYCNIRNDVGICKSFIPIRNPEMAGL